MSQDPIDTAHNKGQQAKALEMPNKMLGAGMDIETNNGHDRFESRHHLKGMEIKLRGFKKNVAIIERRTINL
ncbi:hypothetical protein BGS_0154 [Beggiatoa sp. SS]|nr:hypothetical protein BGS_0154 [Beggiatoa sp. SS]